MTIRRRKKYARSNSPHFEEMEPRILYSADLAPQAVEETIVAETRSVDAHIAPETSDTAIHDPEADVLFLDEEGNVLEVSPAAPIESEQNARQELIFIDSNINNPEDLLESLLKGAAASAQIIEIDDASDAWTQILDSLATREDIDAIHFLSHGSDATLKLGDNEITQDNLHEFEDEFRIMQLSLSENADLLFYGCDIAASSDGQQMLETISEWTGADVAASNDLTGHSSLGGDWDLEYQLGNIETDAAVSATSSNWMGLLSPPTDISNGIAINTNGGTDAFLETSNAINSNLTALTLEVSFAIDTPNVVDNNLFSYLKGFKHNELYLTVDASGNINFAADSIGLGEFISANAYPQLLDGEQHHVAVSWDNSNGGIFLYIDGAFEESTTGYKTGATVNSGGTLVLGQDQDLGSSMDPDQAFLGTYYDTRLWNTIRSASEVADNYQHSFDSGNIPVGLVANWQMKEVTGSDTIVDLVNPGVADLEIKHASGGGFTLGTIEDTLNIDENSANSSHIGFVIPTDPDPGVTPSYSYTLTDNAGGRFAIDLNTGEITVANGSLLNYEASSSHSITIEVTDGDSNTFSKAITIDLNNVNDAPVANAGGPYTAPKGSGITLDGSASSDQDLDTLSYAWDIDNNATYGDVTGVSPSLTWANLQSYGIIDYGVYTIGLQVSDGNGGVDTHQVTITVTDDSPTDLSSGIELNTDGRNDAYLTLPDATPIMGSITGSITLETVFTIDTNSSNWNTLISYANGSSSDELLLSVDASGGVKFSVGGVATTSSTYPDLLDGNQHHVGVTWDATSGSVAFYVDGQFVESALGHQTGYSIGTGGTLVIGKDQDSVGSGFDTAQSFSGTLYDIRIWNEVRSDDDIGLNYQHKVDLTPAEAAAMGLVANWQMDGFNGSSEVVETVSGNNLSIGHAAGVGFVSSTPSSGLDIDENATNGTQVGYVVPSDPDIHNDVVTDGLFLEHAMGAAFEQVSNGSSIGDWDVTQNTAVVFNDPATYGETPLEGRPLELGMSSGPAIIEQTLTTVPGQQYQIIFSLSGDWVGGDAVKQVRVSTGAVTTDFSMSEPNNWSSSNLVWDTRSMTFTAIGATTTLSFESLVTNIPQYNVTIGDVQVIEIPAAISTILANDADLSYDAGTGKFYRVSNFVTSWAGSNASANASALNGVNGNLVSIHSAYENDLVQALAQGIGGDVWIGATDQSIEGEFYWQNSIGDDQQFWTGGNGGSAIGYTNWNPASSPRATTGEDWVVLSETDGEWRDFSEGSSRYFVTEWDALEVLSNYSFSLTDDAGGRFTIDNSTGEITVADSTQIDYETATNHNITVMTTDASGSSYSEVINIGVNNLAGDASWTVPIAQSTSEDTAIVFSGGNSNAIILDSGSPDNPVINVSLSVSQGNLLLASTTGISFLNGSSNSSSTLSISGTESDINTALNGMSYSATSNYNGADTLTVSTGSSAATEANLFARYEFAEGAITDISGNGHNAVAGDSPTSINDAERGDALYFDGNDNLLIANSTLTLGSELTIASWVNLDAAQGDNVVMSLADQFYIELDNNSGGFGIGVYGFGAGTNTVGAGEIDVAGDGWHHVAATFSDANNELKLYIDGVLERTMAVAAVPNWGSYATQDIAIGDLVEPKVGSGPMVGSLDDARIYTSALTQSEIINLMGDQGLASETIGITINAVNDAPTFTNLDGNPTYIEDGTAVVLDANVQILDAELSMLDNFNGASLTLARNGGANAEDIFSSSGALGALTESGSLVVGATTIGTVTTNSAGTLQLSLNSNATNTLVNQALQQIAYSNSDDSPVSSVDIDWSFDDENSGSQGSGGAKQTSGSTTVNITAVNDAPVLSGANNLTTIDEDDVTNSGTLVSDQISGQLSDLDSGASSGIAVIAVDNTNGSWEYTTDGATWLSLGSPDSASARLLASDGLTRVRFVPNANFNGTVSNGITFHGWDQTTGANGGIANISGTATVGDTFSTVSYANNDGTASWTGDWIESDGSGGGASGGDIEVDDGDFNIDLDADNIGDHLYREVDLSGATTATLTFDFNNQLAAGDEIQVQMSANGGSSYTTVQTYTNALNTGPGSAVIDISTYIASDTRVRFYVSNSGVGEDMAVDDVSISFGSASNSAFSTASASSNITVDPVNDIPVITSDGGGATAGINIDENQTAVTTVTATDTDLDTVSYSLSGGVDAGLFTLNSSSGVLTFNTAPDFEVPGDNNTDGVYDVEVTVSDGNGGSDVQTLSITVDDDKDAPTLISLSNSAVNENTDSSSGYSVGSLTTTDADSGDTTSYNIVGGTDAGVFSIGGASSDELILTDGMLDFETQSSYQVIVRVTDSSGLTRDETFNISINNLNEAPTFTSTALTGSTLAFPYNYAITTSDPDSGASLTITAPTLPAWLTFLDNGDGTATLAGTPGLTEAGNHNVSLQVSDGGLSDTQSFTISVSNSNNMPVITSDGAGASASLSIEENQTAVTTATASDADLDTLTYSLSGGADQGIFNIDSSSGVLSFNTAQNFESPTDSNIDGTYEVTVQVDDGLGGMDTQAISISVSDINEFDPTMGNQSFSIDENLANGSNVGTVIASDADTAQTLTYAITSGNIGGAFAINASTGAITVSNSTSLDFETTPVFSLLVSVTDSLATTRTSQATITVSLNNLNDNAPVIQNKLVSLSENAANGDVIADFDNINTGNDVDADGNSLSYSVIAGNDDGIFAIDAVSGAIRIVDASLLDFANNPLYLLQVEASDGSYTSTAQLSIQVSHVNQAPVVSAPGTASTNEDESLSFSTAAGLSLSVSDSDAGSLDIEVTISSNHGTLTLGDQSRLSSLPVADSLNQFVLRGSTDAINQALEGLSFNPESNFNGEASLTLIANDLGNIGAGSALSDSETITITVIPVNDEPLLDVPNDLIILPGDSISFSTTLDNLEPLQDIDSLSTTHNLSLSIQNATLSISDDSLLPDVQIVDGNQLSASGDMATINEILSSLVITPDENFYGDLVLSLELEDEGGATVGSARSLSTEIHLYVGSLPIQNNDESSDEISEQQEDDELDHQLLVEIEEANQVGKKLKSDTDDDEFSIPALTIESDIAAQGETVVEDEHVLDRDFDSEIAPDSRTNSTHNVSKIRALSWQHLDDNAQILSSSGFTPSLLGLQQGLADDDVDPDKVWQVRVAEITGAGFVVGSVVWLLKSSSLLSSLLVSYPAWRGVDPLPVLLPKEEDEEKPSKDELEEKPKNPRFYLNEIKRN